MWNSGSHWKRRRSLVAYDLNHHQRGTTIDELTAARRSGSVQAQALGDWRKDATLNVGQPILMGHSVRGLGGARHRSFLRPHHFLNPDARPATMDDDMSDGEADRIIVAMTASNGLLGDSFEVDRAAAHARPLLPA